MTFRQDPSPPTKAPLVIKQEARSRQVKKMVRSIEVLFVFLNILGQLSPSSKMDPIYPQTQDFIGSDIHQTALIPFALVAQQLDHFASRISLSISLLAVCSRVRKLERGRTKREKMAMWVFGYGSLIWKAGFNYDDRVVGFIKGYRRVFYQGSTDHRGTPEYPGRTVTLEPADGEVCWGVAYKISKKEDQEVALTYLEVREKQYDEKAYLDFFTDPAATTPVVSGVMVYIGSPDKRHNQNYLGPAPLEEIAKQIFYAEGPSGPNRDYLFHLESALLQIGCKDKHVIDLANEVRRIRPETGLAGS